MAKYDLTNEKPFKELTPTESDNIAYEQGYHDAIDKARKAFCKTHGCGIPHSTCISLGTCDEYDSFNEELTKAMED